MSGLGTAENYYRLASTRTRLGEIRRPTLILTADDDPMIPCELFRDIPPTDCLQVHITRGGGHLGFVSNGAADADRRWLDWRILDWTLTRQDAPKDATGKPASFPAPTAIDSGPV
jgi:hypothetical protein